MILIKAALTRSNIRFRLKSGEKNILNKIVRLKKILRRASHQKNLDKGIGYRSITLESRSEKYRF